MKQISGGVCAAAGFTAAGIHAGVKAGSDPAKKDLAMILSETECTAAAMYTNACAPKSHEHAEEMCQAAADATGRSPRDFVVASTGVIGQELNVNAITTAIPELTTQLNHNGSDAAASAIMTTDTVKKEVAVQVELGGKVVTLGGIAKGSGMIHPNMGTMLCFLTSDCAITSEMLNNMLHEVVPRTFNRVTVDGDTSTNDTCAVLCNGMAGNELIEWKDNNYAAFKAALTEVLTVLSRAIAGDGEGASRLITCTVTGSRSEDAAERLSKAIVGSSLVKAAMFGADANWGRVLCAMGYSKAPFRPERVDVKFRSVAGEVLVCEHGSQVLFDEDKAKEILSQDEVIIEVDVHEGDNYATCWGCDLTYDYVKINGDYRT
jgi:glutamate N-acetyltransferase/amino-acid N-acetyltransferase